ncbi:MAG: restriction endonuclease [Dehalococcoidia bacterium]|nr:restriction endonuclease [Dehalococcoidia bacterium]
MTPESAISRARREFHADLLRNVIRVTPDGRPNYADKDSALSTAIAGDILQQLGTGTEGTISGQAAGAEFERACERFLNGVFPLLAHLRPGPWIIDRTGPVSRQAAQGIAKFEQYEHLVALKEATEGGGPLAAAIGADYLIKPDVMVYRQPLDDTEINTLKRLVDGETTTHSGLRKANQPHAMLHASVSCKWTIRSDRSQNARAEALNLMRNRKGRVPHAVLITAEPLPSRIASIALGTGDLDCVYHFALYELREAVHTHGNEDSVEMLTTMVDGKRLKDISDLPLDLAV